MLNFHSTGNMCKLQIAECEAKLHHRFLGLAHTGRCSSGGTVTTPDHYDCRHPEPCDEEESTGEVCGTDGVTYSMRDLKISRSLMQLLKYKLLKLKPLSSDFKRIANIIHAIQRFGFSCVCNMHIIFSLFVKDFQLQEMLFLRNSFKYKNYLLLIRGFYFGAETMWA